MKLTYENRMAVAAHRGDCYSYYENTMTAFERAYESGCDMIETDIHLTKDNVLVLIHDHTVDRTTNSKGRVCDLTLEQLLKLNAGDSLHPEKIPLFSDFMAWARDKKLTLNLEIKEYYSPENEERCKKCIDLVIDEIEKQGMRERVVINSFDAWVLEYVYKKHGKKYMLHGFYPYNEMMNVSMEPEKYLYCACIFDNENKAYFDYLISKGIEPWVGASVTQISKLELCLKNGAKLITTNNPKDIIDKLKELGNGRK